MNPSSIEHMMQQLNATTDLAERRRTAKEIIDEIATPAMEDALKGRQTGELGTYLNVDDPEQVVALIEIVHQCLEEGGDLSGFIIPIARLHHLDRKESEKTDTELYLQYRAAALLDALVAAKAPFPDEAVQLILAAGKRYVKDKATEQYICSIHWRLADSGVNISGAIPSLVTVFKNGETSELVRYSLLALWAAVRQGYFDTPIPDSDLSYQVWLKHLISSGTYKLKKKDEPHQLGIIGCLIETIRTYPEFKALAVEYLEQCKIREPKRLTTDLQQDLKQYFDLCRE
ncbi:hypothetical protein YDYSG_61330 [Paenibacillus tyrfis]|uniref:hypothetical protein n=1 Tax=Paenibacillus TaxID=44249 RepID=UPI0024912018|nr:hypothetical protein [Paenibacillus tyrfis]GLI10100.1 hypothetical protein YDYSG_61330 [Paenibacillus tyrfis]GMX62571.1 hypothetical protein Elgi_23760 [Paenibacillus elgii]